jgi:uncharacterized protein (UPF0216 family)
VTTTFRTPHYTFLDNTRSVQIVNRDGKKFYVMTDELIEFVAHLVRLKKVEKLMSMTTNEVLGVK